MVRTPRFHCRHVGLTPGRGTKIPQAVQHSQKKTSETIRQRLQGNTEGKLGKTWWTVPHVCSVHCCTLAPRTAPGPQGLLYNVYGMNKRLTKAEKQTWTIKGWKDVFRKEEEKWNQCFWMMGKGEGELEESKGDRCHFWSLCKTCTENGARVCDWKKKAITLFFTGLRTGLKTRMSTEL